MYHLIIRGVYTLIIYMYYTILMMQSYSKNRLTENIHPYFNPHTTKIALSNGTNRTLTPIL